MLLDSNILIYAAEPEGAFLSRWVEDAAACLATVSRIEVLGFPRWHLLDETRCARLELLVGALPELPLDDRIAACAIGLRRQKRREFTISSLHYPATSRCSAKRPTISQRMVRYGSNGWAKIPVV